ncbi:hypothetical protein CFE70_010031 [Pyrenophora teres f. teres 0-1]
MLGSVAGGLGEDQHSARLAVSVTLLLTCLMQSDEPDELLAEQQQQHHHHHHHTTTHGDDSANQPITWPPPASRGRIAQTGLGVVVMPMVLRENPDAPGLTQSPEGDADTGPAVHFQNTAKTARLADEGGL